MKSDLQELLAALTALYHLHWTCHWQAMGSYGDHLLFERLYEAIQEEIDTLAEKMVTMYGNEVVELSAQHARVQRWLSKWSDVSSLPLQGLNAERDIQKLLKEVYSDDLPMGLDDFIQGVANTHDTHVYLLKQRASVKEASGHRAWTTGELETLEDGQGVVNTRGMYFIRSSERNFGWIAGHPDHDYSSVGDTKPLGKLRLLKPDEVTRGLVQIADITPKFAVIEVPTRKRSDAEKIGRFLLSSEGEKILQKRAERLGVRGRRMGEMNLQGSKIFVEFTLP